MSKPLTIFLGLLRLAMGLIFLWSFFDKVFGLGFSTESGKAWLDGVSPTIGYLTHGTKGPFAAFYQSLAGNAFVTWLFMLGLLGLGLSLILGIGVRIAGYAGAVLMLILWSTHLPPEQNPLIDDHIIYALVLLSFTMFPVGEYLGLGRWWTNLLFVRRYPFLG